MSATDNNEQVATVNNVAPVIANGVAPAAAAAPAAISPSSNPPAAAAVQPSAPTSAPAPQTHTSPAHTQTTQTTNAQRTAPTAAPAPTHVNAPHPSQAPRPAAAAAAPAKPLLPAPTAPPAYLPYQPSTSLVGTGNAAPSASSAGSQDSSFWDMFSSSAPQAKVSKELADWSPDISFPPPATTIVLAAETIKAAAALEEADKRTQYAMHQLERSNTGDLKIPSASSLKLGFVDELGEYHAMLEWSGHHSNAAQVNDPSLAAASINPASNPAPSPSSSSSSSSSTRSRRENKHTSRARDAAKEILGSIQHHRGFTPAAARHAQQQAHAAHHPHGDGTVVAISGAIVPAPSHLHHRVPLHSPLHAADHRMIGVEDGI